jgi:phage baseplate assembly protein W
MIPSIDILTEEITEVTRPNKTYKVAFDKNRINGYVDDLDSVAQAVDLILSTERYKYIIYSWDYGVELYDLIGKPMPYVMSELPRRITEALTQDNRIDDVVDFEFTRNGKKLHVTFTVVTNLGNLSSALEVEV